MGDREIAAMASMAERYDRPDWVKRINAMGDSVAGARHIVSLNADELFHATTEGLGTGTNGDFGQPGWESAFENLVAMLDAGPMNVLGRLMTRQELVRCLRTRLLLTQHWDSSPSLAQEKVAEPVVITGPARSGTSILFELLSLDPALHAPPTWEVLHPRAVPGVDHDDRSRFAQCESELWTDIQPELAALHEWRSDLPAECITLTAPSFVGQHWAMIADGVPVDPVANYAFHKRVLQTMQADRTGRVWLLKTPAHLMTVDLLFATYPDAWVVQTHRDPAKTMPSTVSMTAGVKWMRSDHVDLAALATHIRQGFSWALNSATARRTAGELPDRFVDVHFQSLVDDPAQAVGDAYSAMGREFTDEHAHRIERYVREKPQGKFGIHRYTPEEWGYTADELREDLASYIETFSIAYEDQ